MGLPFYIKGYVRRYIPLDSGFFHRNQKEEYLRSIETERLWRHRRKNRGDRKMDFFKSHKSTPFKSFGTDWFEKDGVILLSEHKIPIKWEFVRYATSFFDENDKVVSNFENNFISYEENAIYSTTLDKALNRVKKRGWKKNHWPYKFLTAFRSTSPTPPSDTIVTFNTPTISWFYIPNCHKCHKCQARLIDRYWNTTTLEIPLDEKESKLLQSTLDKMIPFISHRGYETCALEKGVKILHLYDAAGCLKGGKIFLDAESMLFVPKMIETLIHETVHASKPEKGEKEVKRMSKRLANEFGEEYESTGFLEEYEKTQRNILESWTRGIGERASSESN